MFLNSIQVQKIVFGTQFEFEIYVLELDLCKTRTQNKNKFWGKISMPSRSVYNKNVVTR